MIGRAMWSNLQRYGNESHKLAPPTALGGHLSCFFPGLLALYGGQSGDTERVYLAERLVHTCWQLYNTTATGVGAEYFGLIQDRTTNVLRRTPSTNETSQPNSALARVVARHQAESKPLPHVPARYGQSEHLHEEAGGKLPWSFWIKDRSNKLRPEVVESLMYTYVVPFTCIHLT